MAEFPGPALVVARLPGTWLEAAAVSIADWHVAAFALLLIAVVAGSLVCQPAQRIAIAWGTAVAIGVLTLVAVIPLEPLWRLPSPTSAIDARLGVEAAPTPTASPRLPQPVATATPANEVEATELPDEASERPPLYAQALMVYAAVSTLVAVWLVAGSIAARRLTGKAERGSSALQAILARLAGPQATTRLLISDQLETPAAVGTFRPSILLPRRLATNATAEDLQAVIAHELAHVKNGDLLLLAIMRGLLVLLWPNPLFWVVRRRVRFDQEMLADAAAVGEADRAAYAERLVRWARQTKRAPRLIGVAGFLEQPSQLRRRVAVLLDERYDVRSRCGRVWQVAVGVVLIPAAIVSSAVSLSPAAAPEAADQSAAADGFVAAGPSPPSSTFTTTVTVSPQSNQPTTRADLPGTIRGVCVGANGQPIVGVEIALHRFDINTRETRVQSTARSDAEGRFRFDQVAPTQEVSDGILPQPEELILITARQPGLASQSVATVRRRVGNEGIHASFTLVDAATVRGRVLDSQGRPISGALVRAELQSGSIAPSDGSIFGATTDADGRYAISDLPPADFEALGRQEAEQQRRMAEQADGTVFFGFTQRYIAVSHPDFAAAKGRLDRSPGVVDVVLQPAASVVGSVIDDNGRPVPNLPVLIAWDPSQAPAPTESRANFALQSHHERVTTGADGTYRFTNLPSGPYRVQLILENASPEMPEQIAAGTATLSVTPGETPVEASPLRVTNGWVVSVQLIDEASGEPLAFDERMVAGVYFQPTGRQFGVSNGALRVSEDGKLRCRVLPQAGKLMIHELRLESDWESRSRWKPAPSVAIAAQSESTGNAVAYPINPGTFSIGSFLREADELAGDGKIDEALAVLTEQLEMRPTNTRLLLKRAEIAKGWGRDAEAIADYEAILNAEPDNWAAMNNLSDALVTAKESTLRDAPRALELAERAIELLPQPFFIVYDSLAAAQAANGDFEASVASQEKAVELAPERFRADLREKLENYRADRP